MSTDTRLVSLPDLQAHLARWVDDGVVTPSQAEEILAEENRLAPVSARSRTSLVTEALGYLGGLLVVIASILLVARSWHDLSVTARLVLVGGATAALLVAGGLLRGAVDTAAGRFRATVWGLSAAAAAFFVGLFGYEVLDLRGRHLALLITAATAGLAAALWTKSRAFVQQAVCFAALSGTAAAALAELAPAGSTRDTLPGAGIVVVGALWLSLTVQGRVGPRRLSLLLAGAGVVVGAVVVQPSGWGHFAALAVVLALVGAALRIGDLALLGVGALGVLLVLPVVVNEWFPGAVAAPLALLASGVLLVLLALHALRSREQE